MAELIAFSRRVRIPAPQQGQAQQELKAMVRKVRLADGTVLSVYSTRVRTA